MPGQNRGPEYGRIQRICSRLAEARTRGEAGIQIAREVSAYSLFDLQVIMGRVRHEVHRLPPPYRNAAGPYLLSQIVDAHHSLLTTCTRGEFSCMNEPLREREQYLAYLRMVPDGCYASDPKAEYLPQFHSPMHRMFYYLLAAYVMFVQERPGHPVGTPFPGGGKVEEREGAFFCPVRDKHKEVSFAICNFCPARQADER
ncbi:MAG: hypothetical protein A4E37_02206 [Methanoregulaceae archaeon PtaB.Bin056]|jgi:uncharacterized protein (UPF0305 family)|nr:MAG: hypothetical protein A4E37_02206 [Methanoregulaceae archaeon PtaB.Bin056]